MSLSIWSYWCNEPTAQNLLSRSHIKLKYCGKFIMNLNEMSGMEYEAVGLFINLSK